MEKLTIKELAPYLPYRLKVIYNNEETKDIISTMTGIEDQNNILTEKHFVSMNFAFKPILRPLSDLTKEIEFCGEKFVFMSKIKESQHHLFFREDIENPILSIQYSEMQKLFEWHFDVFGLIEKGLAIDINTIYEGV